MATFWVKIDKFELQKQVEHAEIVQEMTRILTGFVKGLTYVTMFLHLTFPSHFTLLNESV